MSRALIIALAALFIGTATVSIIAFRYEHSEHDRLAAQLTALRAQNAATERLAAENSRMTELIDLSRRDRQQAAAALGNEVERARQEVSELEGKAASDNASMLTQSRRQMEALQANRDLSKGPVLIENCADLGRATPEDALQTLIWAAAHGRDDIVQSTLTFDAATRALAEKAIAALPESVRVKYPTPESLGALFIAQVVNDLTGIRVVDRTVNGSEATLNVNGLQKRIGNISLKQGPEGWQAVINSAVFERIDRMLLSPPRK